MVGRNLWDALKFEVREVAPGILILVVWTALAIGAATLAANLTNSDAGGYLAALAVFIVPFLFLGE